MTEAADPIWRCEKCGTEYTADVGKCGQLQPPCDGTVREASRYDPATRTHYVPVGPDVQEAAGIAAVVEMRPEDEAEADL